MAIQEIWTAKKLHEQEKQVSVHLQDYMHMHLLRSAPHTTYPSQVLPCCALLQVNRYSVHNVLTVGHLQPSVPLCLTLLNSKENDLYS